MQKAIQQIIKDVPSGCVFDSHFVITRLIKKKSDEYLTFASSIDAATDKTLAVHGKIGQEIAKFESGSIRRMVQVSWSENVHGIPSPCTSWEKL